MVEDLLQKENVSMEIFEEIFHQSFETIHSFHDFPFTTNWFEISFIWYCIKHSSYWLFKCLLEGTDFYITIRYGPYRYYTDTRSNTFFPCRLFQWFKSYQKAEYPEVVMMQARCQKIDGFDNYLDSTLRLRIDNLYPNLWIFTIENEAGEKFTKSLKTNECKFIL